MRSDDTTVALCIEGAIPSDTVIDISEAALPARSLILGDEYSGIMM